MWLGREVALKVLHPHLAAPDLVERFRREARIIASVPHPNIAAVSEIGEHGGLHYIAIEYVPHSLAELMARGALDVNLAVSIAHQTALALEAARTSESAITHHDVKPDNILLTSLDAEPVVKLIDFGIAHAEGMTSITQTGSQWGTPLYMPPEQWAGERGDTRSDIYSLGVVLYHALAGRPPFNSDAANNVAKQTEIARQHQQTAAPPLRSIRGDVSEALDAIIAKCIAKPPSARYQTPDELANELGAMLGQPAHPSEPKPESRPPRPSRQPAPPKPRNRIPLIAAIGFGAVIVAVLVALVILQSGDSAQDSPPRIAAAAPPTAPPPRASAGGAGISAGVYRTCALRENGEAECWGYDAFGQSDLPATPFAAISVGGNHTCALREDGAAECRGLSFAGQSDPPAGTFAAISAGRNHTCALREDGAAECWGSVLYNQTDPPAGTFVAISAGEYHTCALREGGAAVCWGNNEYGQTDPPIWTFAAISAGAYHTCALREDGVAECWGDNFYGQTNPPAGAFAAISAGAYHTCALREGGAAECWGDSEYGKTVAPAGAFAR